MLKMVNKIISLRFSNIFSWFQIVSKVEIFYLNKKLNLIYRTFENPDIEIAALVLLSKKM